VLNCKPGDLARVVAPGYFLRCTCGMRTLAVKPDTLVVCARPFADGWFLAEPLKIETVWACDPSVRLTGTCGSLPDSLLRPIRDPGDDAVDETLIYAGDPRVREVQHG
jgi:hypothetical protein